VREPLFEEPAAVTAEEECAMEAIVISVDGMSMMLDFSQADVSSLVLDEYNPRISFYKDNQPIDHLDQKQVVFGLTCKNPEAFSKLKESIRDNKGVVNPIWIEPIEGGRKFRVVEGNTRAAIYLQLRAEEPGELRWETIPAYILPTNVQANQRNFIRLQSHLRGTTPWDAYEKAKYLYRLWQVEGWSIDRLEQQTKLSARQVRENIDAYRLMDEQYLPQHIDNPNEVAKFSYFVEYVKDRELRKEMKNADLNDDTFCQWVGEANMLPAARDVRSLRAILEMPDVRDTYLRSGFEVALERLSMRKPYAVSAFYADVQAVVDGLKTLRSDEIWEAAALEGEAKLALLRELVEWATKVVRMAENARDGKQGA
jgi:hypothetical protein